MISGISIFIFLCTFVIPELIILGWRRFLKSKYEAKNGTINLVYHIFCMTLLLWEFQASIPKTIMLWSFMSIAFVGMIALFIGAMVGTETEFLFSESRIYKSFKMFGHPYVIFSLTMSVSFFMYIFQF